MAFQYPENIPLISPPESVAVAVLGGTHMNEAIFDHFEFSGWFTVETAVGKSPRFYLGERDGIPFLYSHFHGECKFVETWLALQELGVREAIGGASCGGIHPTYQTDDLCVPHDFIDQNIDRPPGFPPELLPADYPSVARFQPAMDETLRSILFEEACGVLRADRSFDAVNIHRAGVVLQSRGGRMETPAEIRMAANYGADLVTMNISTEMVFARTLGIHFAALTLIANPAEGVADWSWDSLGRSFQRMNPPCVEIILRAVARAGALDPKAPRTLDGQRSAPDWSSRKK